LKRSERTPVGLIRAARSVGATAIYLTPQVAGDGPELAEVLPIVAADLLELPVYGLHASLGAARLQRPQAALAAISATDRDEAAAAVAVVEAALALAGELKACAVTVPLGEVDELERLFEVLRGRLLRGAISEDDKETEDFQHARRALSRRHLDASRRSLEKIAETAARLGVTVLIPNPRRATFLPTAIELRVLMTDLAGAPVSPVLDIPAAHLTSTMRLCPLRETVLAFGNGCAAFVADACGAVGGLPPGHGEVEVSAIARSLKKDAQRIFVPWPGLRRAEVMRGYQAVSRL
jgi:sugar phosphate isomerase/epimerase